MNLSDWCENSVQIFLNQLYRSLRMKQRHNTEYC